MAGAEGGDAAAAPAGPLDRMAAFRAACPEAETLQVERSDQDAALLGFAGRVAEAVVRVEAATERLRDPALALAAYEQASEQANAATSEAQAAAADLLDAEPEANPRWAWRRRAAGQATQRLQEVLVQASAARIAVAVRAHLAARGDAHARVRAALERQIVLACPRAKDARLDHLSEDALQAFVQEAALGNRSGGLVQSARKLRSVEQSVSELREMLAHFAMLVEAQSEQVSAAGRAVETAHVHVADAEQHLKLAKESNDVYMRAKFVVIAVTCTVLFLLCGGFSALPEWLSFSSSFAREEVRLKLFLIEPDFAPAVVRAEAGPVIGPALGDATRVEPGAAPRMTRSRSLPARASMVQAEPVPAAASVSPAGWEVSTSQTDSDPKLRPCRGCLLLRDT